MVATRETRTTVADIIADYERQISALRTATDVDCEVPSWLGRENAIRRLQDELHRFRRMVGTDTDTSPSTPDK